jgi:hypothetical protein
MTAHLPPTTAERVALANELRPFAEKTLGSIRLDVAEVRKIVAALDRLDKLSAEVAAKDAEIEKLNSRLAFALDEGTSWACKAGRYARSATAAEAEAAGLRAAIGVPFAVVFLDGRNEHGTHVLGSYPINLPIEDKDIQPFAEEIMSAAETLGFKAGEDHVWTTWRWNSPQYGDEGRIEFEGYWEFVSIDEPMSLSPRMEASDAAVS